MDASKLLEVFGTTQQAPLTRRLSAGPLSCVLSEGAIHDVRWDGTEVLRGVFYLFRDRNWGTAPATVRDLTIEESPGHFAVHLVLEIVAPEGKLRAEATIIGSEKGKLIFEVKALPQSTLTTNRCGFVVLHPAGVAGRALQVEHTSGLVTNSSFPREISPSQPVLDIRTLDYSPESGIEVSCRLEAELPCDPSGKFEMEDQRNWSDASFKTYVASLLDPWPYQLAEGRVFSQRVNLHVRGQASRSRPRDGVNTITIGPALGATMPEIGVGVPQGLHRALPAELSALRGLGAAWWTVEVAIDSAELALDLQAVRDAQRGLPARIQIDAIVPSSLAPQAAAMALAEAAAKAQLHVDAVRLLPTLYLKSYQPADHWPDLPPLEDYASAARSSFPTALIGGGMFTYFTELNRKRQSSAGIDFIGHATSPLVHAADDRSVMQTMEALPHIVHSVKACWPDVSYRLGPSSIAMRRNPYGEATAPNPELGRVAMASMDPRHGARFGATWLAAYAAEVCPLGVEVLSLLDSHGPSGPLKPTAGAASDDGPLVPAWTLLATLAKAKGAQIVSLSGLPSVVSAIAWSRDGRMIEGLIANKSERTVELNWGGARSEGGSDQTGLFVLEAFEARAFETVLD